MSVQTATSRESADRGDLVRHEQEVLDRLYGLLHDETARTAAALNTAAHTDIGSTPGAVVERDALVRSHAMRLTQLRAAEQRLCFGRIDQAEGATFYLGRVGLAQPDGNARALLDWRAPAAAAFYQATGAVPMGLRGRRHLHTEGRRVIDVVDELLDVDTAAATGEGSVALDANSALLAALDAPRDGRMHEVVATIQLEQDRIIRASLRGTLVVQGAPGTGKTVVALHRAAYLLYTYRAQLTSGVLVVGPGEAFMRYIGQVLPSLGETGASLLSLARLHPGAEATADEAPAVAALKGDLRMIDVLRTVATTLPRVPAEPLALDVDGETVMLTPRDVESAMARARSENLPHNEARVTFVREVLERLVRRLSRVVGYAPEDVAGATRIELLRSLHASRDVRREVNRCWPLATPERLLRRVYRGLDLGVTRRSGLSRNEYDLLLRDPESGWTVADIALLDEAAELLGEDPEPRRRAAAARVAARVDEVQYAQDVAEMTGADGIVDGERLASRYTGGENFDGEEGGGPQVYGHVVVDEAQELTAMQWRAVLRRCPSRSMTVVGDIAQATSPGAASSWEAALAPHLGERWNMAELTVNYRLPRAINDLAHDVLIATGGDIAASVSPTRAVRDRPDSVTRWPTPTGPVEALVAQLANEALAAGPGTVAVIAASGRVAELTKATADEPASRLSVLTPVQAKGLEFDTVIVVTPIDLLAEVGPRGLYVALTRATQRLHVVGELPARPGVASPAPRGG